MIHLSPSEKILLILHKHWIAVVSKFIAGLILAFVPILLVPGIFAANLIPMPAEAAPIILFFLIIYLMVIALLLFIFWIDYYLDMWIVTNERIIDINQKGLFQREITEFRLDKIQNITVKIPDVVATFLKYGDLIIETAGESSFTISQIPKVYEAKNLILDLTNNTLQNVGAQQMGANKI